MRKTSKKVEKKVEQVATSNIIRKKAIPDKDVFENSVVDINIRSYGNSKIDYDPYVNGFDFNILDTWDY